jgi:hypothetical protein
VNWLKGNWKTLVPLFTVFASVIGAAIGVKLTVKTDPNATQPEIHVVIPAAEGGDVSPVQGVQAFARERSPVNSLVSLRSRRLAVAELQKSGMDRAEAWRRVNAIPESAVAQAVIEAGVPKEVYGAFGDGTILKRIIEWLSDPANQERIQAIVAFLIKMALLFAADVDFERCIVCYAWMNVQEMVT